MGIEETKNTNILDSRLFLPSWWIKAFLQVFLQQDGRSGFNKAIRAGITPLQSVDEMNIIALLISHLQDHMLSRKEGSPASYRIVLKNVLSDRGFSSPAKMPFFERTLQGFSGLKFLKLSADSLEYQVIPLFSGEKWEFSNNEPQSIIYEPSAHSSELLLGYIEPYSEMLRQVSGVQEITNITDCSHQQPLCVWKPIWLDFNASEQAILLGLEIAMQWEFRLLQLEGAFGQSFGPLFQGVNFPESKTNKNESNFVKYLKLLNKVGKKLNEHGLISNGPADLFLALGNERQSEELKIVWQATKERFFSEEANCYRDLVGKYYIQYVVPPSLDRITSLLTGTTDQITSLKIREMYPQIFRCQEQDLLRPITVLDGTKLLLPQLVFLEWMIRSLPGHPIPLPEVLLTSEIRHFLAPVAKEAFLENFIGFTRLVMQSPDYLSSLKNMALATIVSEPSKKTLEVAGFLKAGSRFFMDIDGHSSRNIAEVSVIEEKASPPQNKPKPQVQYPDINHKLLAQMKRTAAEELRNIKRNSREKYVDLRKKYFQSLDEMGRKLFLEVQTRMQPDLFEEHLNHRLVNFMVENPSSWHSSDYRPLKQPLF